MVEGPTAGSSDDAPDAPDARQPHPAAPGSAWESVATAQRSVATLITALPKRADLQALRKAVDRLLGPGSHAHDPGRSPASPPTPEGLQRVAGHLGVLADEADVAVQPFGTEGGLALRRAAVDLRRAASAGDPAAALLGLRHSMAGRLEALATFSLVVRQPATVVANLSRLLADLRRRVDQGEDRVAVAADLRRVAGVLAVEVIPFYGDGSPGAALVRSRVILFRRSADWFQHPAHGPVVGGGQSQRRA